MARLMQIVAGDTEPPFSAYLPFDDVPTFLEDGVTPNPDTPVLPAGTVVTFIMRKRTGTTYSGTAVSGTAEILSDTLRQVKHSFTKATSLVEPGQYHPSWQVDYPDERRQTHLHPFEDFIEVLADAGGPE